MRIYLTKFMKAIILARVSTEEQKEAGNSLPAQIERLKTYCKNRGFKIAKIFSFDESAYKTKRDEFDDILKYLKTDKEKIVVCFDKVDRFSRNVFDKRVAYLYELAMQDKIELHFASDNLAITANISATEKFHFGINLGLAKYYSDAISDNVKRAYENKIRKGEWIGKAPVGYSNTPDEAGNKSIIPDPARSHFIIEMFKKYGLGGLPIKTIHEVMKKLGLRDTGKGFKPLSGGMVYHILRNPFYYSQMRIKDKLYPHKYPPLITKDLFDKCQEVMASYHKKPFKYASKPYMFRGLIKCAECGCTITPETSKGHTYYSCTNFKGLHSKRIYVPEEKLLEPVLKALEGIQLPDDRVKEIIEDIKSSQKNKNRFHDKALAGLQQEYATIQKRIDRLFDLRIDDPSITNDMFNNKIKELKENQMEITVKLQQYTQADENYYITASTVLNLAQRALSIFQNSEVMEKRQLLNFLLQNPQLQGRNLVFTLKAPFDTVLEANRYVEMLRR